MLMRLLVPVRGDGRGRAAVAHAAALAHRHRAHVVVIHCRARPEDLMPYGSLMPAFARETMLEQAREMADQEEAALREALHGLAEALELTETDTPDGSRATVAFEEAPGRMPDIVKEHGRLADLIVVPRPDRDRNLGTNALKAALFQTGRPVLMCPHEEAVHRGFAEHVAVGWNGSLEAARAVALTLDLVAGARRVSVLAAGSGEPHGAGADRLRDYYAVRGVAAELVRFEARRPGAALLERAGEIGAGLLVMGAYGQSHERETLFGGNTQIVVDEAAVPVVMAH